MSINVPFEIASSKCPILVIMVLLLFIPIANEIYIIFLKIQIACQHGVIWNSTDSIEVVSNRQEHNPVHQSVITFNTFNPQIWG